MAEITHRGGLCVEAVLLWLSSGRGVSAGPSARLGSGWDRLGLRIPSEVAKPSSLKTSSLVWQLDTSHTWNAALPWTEHLSEAEASQ